jgi:hypothetical protein
MKEKKYTKPLMVLLAYVIILFAIGCNTKDSRSENEYSGRWVSGSGDKEFLNLVDQAFESMQPSPQMANIALLYKRDWDGFVEATNWPCWWIQNSFGPSYSMMPFLQEPYATWLEHSQALWFRLMGDGKRINERGDMAPDGCLCDAAGVYMNGGESLGFGDPRIIGRYTNPVLDGTIHNDHVSYRQGDGEVDLHDWFIGTTAAGLILESDRLLIRHDIDKAKKRLPQLQRVAAFLDSRRDTVTNLLKAGRAANLLAPSYKGFISPAGKAEFAYLTELSVNYSAGLKKLVEVCELTGNNQLAKGYRETADRITTALSLLMDNKGSFIMSLDPDGTRHGIFGAEKHGYFEATPNHDAVCFGVIDDSISKKIIKRMVSIPELAPYDLILPNYPSYDDHSGEGAMSYGTWVNGGHWTTTQGRMNIACMRVDEFDHPFKSWKRMLGLMQGFRADAPMKERGAIGWFHARFPFDIVYDCWGAPGGLLRGLFEYDYHSDGLRIRPHLPPDITRLTQKWPVMFGKTQIYLSITGTGTVKSALADGEALPVIDGWIEIKPDGTSGILSVEILRGDAKPRRHWKPDSPGLLKLPEDKYFWQVPENANPDKRHVDLKHIYFFYQELVNAGYGNSYEAAMARASLELLSAMNERIKLLKDSSLVIPDLTPVLPCDNEAVNLNYFEKARFIAGGLVDRLNGYSIWNEHSDPEIIAIARKTKLIK